MSVTVAVAGTVGVSIPIGVRVVNVSDSPSQERLKALVSELRTAVQDRFEQLELLPFRRS